MSAFGTELLNWRHPKELFQVFTGTVGVDPQPVGIAFGLQPGQKYMQCQVWPAYQDDADSNVQSIVCGVEVFVHRSLRDHHDETIYIHDEMLVDMSQLERHDSWHGANGLAAVDEIIESPEGNQPTMANHVISYSVAMQLRVAVT